MEPSCPACPEGRGQNSSCCLAAQLLSICTSRLFWFVLFRLKLTCSFPSMCFTYLYNYLSFKQISYELWCDHVIHTMTSKHPTSLKELKCNIFVAETSGQQLKAEHHGGFRTLSLSSLILSADGEETLWHFWPTVQINLCRTAASRNVGFVLWLRWGDQSAGVRNSSLNRIHLHGFICH